MQQCHLLEVRFMGLARRLPFANIFLRLSSLSLLNWLGLILTALSLLLPVDYSIKLFLVADGFGYSQTGSFFIALLA